MKSIITKWGNSLALRIPSPFAKELDIEEDGSVDLSLEKDRLVIRKEAQSLKDLLALVSDQNLHKETDTGQVIGKELW